MTYTLDCSVKKTYIMFVSYIQLTYTQRSLGEGSIERTCSPDDECENNYIETAHIVTITACCDEDRCNNNLKGDTKIMNLKCYQYKYLFCQKLSSL